MTLIISQQLKHLQTKRTKILTEIKSVSEDVSALKHRQKTLNAKMIEVDVEIQNLQDNQETLIVSEHAILQYLTRFLDINVEQICKDILSEKTISQAETLGDGLYPLAGGGKMRVKDKVIVTII